MEKLTFTKDSINASFWNPEIAKWEIKPVESTGLPITWFLPYEVEIEDEVTVAQILKLIEPYSEQINFVFMNYLKGLQFSTLQEALSSAKSGKDSIEADVVCLLLASELKELDEEYQVDTFPTIMALEVGEDEDSDDDQFHPLHDMSVSQLLNTPLFLDDWLEFYEESDPTDTLFECSVKWSLFDFLRGLLSELAIYAYGVGLVTFAEGSGLVPINSQELFEHINILDNFFKESGQNGN